MQLQIHARVEGVDPRRFWQESPGASTWQSMLDKYAALADSAQLADGVRGEDYKRALLRLSSRWPGALREGELIGPERVDARRLAAERGLSSSPRTRADWVESPACAVLCWAELHRLIRDQLVFRRQRRRKGASSTHEFATWLAESRPDSPWPSTPPLAQLVGSKLEVRGAYLCLAARAGLDLPTLNAVLFARTGHWDRRAEDPAWAHP